MKCIDIRAPVFLDDYAIRLDPERHAWGRSPSKPQFVTEPFYITVLADLRKTMIYQWPGKRAIDNNTMSKASNLEPTAFTIALVLMTQHNPSAH